MYVKKISLKNYRNIFKIRPRIKKWSKYFLWTENAQGKTNLLESIYKVTRKAIGHIKIKSL